MKNHEDFYLNKMYFVNNYYVLRVLYLLNLKLTVGLKCESNSNIQFIYIDTVYFKVISSHF